MITGDLQHGAGKGGRATALVPKRALISDPWALAALATAGVLAALLPARRAARVDPMVALRND